MTAAHMSPRQSSGDRSSTNVWWVLYQVMGQVDDSQPNAFRLSVTTAAPSLEDIVTQFPLGRQFHFSFQGSKRGKIEEFIDLYHLQDQVPILSQHKIVAKVFPLDKMPIYTTEMDSIPIDKDLSCPTIKPSAAAPVLISPPPISSRKAKCSPLPTSNSPFRKNSKEVFRNPNPNPNPNPPPPAPAEALKKTLTEASSGALSEVLSDLARQSIKIEDAKIVAKAKAKQAKRWLGALTSSFSTSLGLNETLDFGSMKVVVQNLVAEGGYAQVYLVLEFGSKRPFAMKQLLRHSKEAGREIDNERECLKSVQHPNVIELVESSDLARKGSSLFLFPFYPRGSIYDVMLNTPPAGEWPLDERECLRLMIGICKGLMAMHEQGWTHRDIKPHNILLSSQTQAQPLIMDCGSAGPLTSRPITSRAMALEIQERAERQSSAPFRAPELFDCPFHNGDDDDDGSSSRLHYTSADIWSLGCTLFTMAFGHSPFEHPRDGFQKLACLQGKLAFPRTKRHRQAVFSLDFCELLSEMCSVEPTDRPSMLDVLDICHDLYEDITSRSTKQ